MSDLRELLSAKLTGQLKTIADEYKREVEAHALRNGLSHFTAAEKDAAYFKMRLNAASMRR